MHSITQFYLNAMGIQTWRLRQQQQQQQQQSTHAYGLLRNNVRVGCLWVMQTADSGERWQEVEQLLQAIATALKLELVKLLNDNIAPPSEKFILIMGLEAANNKLALHCAELASVRGKLLQDKNFNLPVIVTEHPFRLIADPALKRQVWQDLQLVLRLL